MEGVHNLIQSVFQCNIEYIPTFSKALEDHQTFSLNLKTSTVADPIVSYINTLLNSQSNRFEGLLLLKTFVTQCSGEILIDKSTGWISTCTKICSQKNVTKEIPIAIEILNDITRRSKEIYELGKNISNNLLAKIIESCVGHSELFILNVTQLLKTILKLYPGPCGVHKNLIQKIIAKFIDSANKEIVVEVAKCQHLLNQIRGGGVQGVSHKNAWAQYHLQLIGSIHDCFDIMYANTSETFEGSNVSERFIMTELSLSDDPVEKAVQITTRCGNLINYLEVALTDPFPVPKAVHPVKVLNLIQRGLEINCSTIAKNLITDNIAIGMLLLEIHVKLFRLLDGLIQILGTNLLVYSKQICQMFVQSLKWTSTGKSFGRKRPFTNVRIATYNSLMGWCSMAKYGSTIENYFDQIIDFIIQDTTPFHNEITLSVLSGSRKQMSKKARKRLHNAQNVASSMSQKHSNVQNTKTSNNDVGNETLCAIALDCLSIILESGGYIIKPILLNALHEHIVLYAIKTVDSTNLNENLYNSKSCRIKLFTCLKNLILCGNPMTPAPIQYALQIFSRAQIIDNNVEVKNICRKFLKDLEQKVHPKKETLYFPSDPNEIEEALQCDEAEHIETDVDSENDCIGDVQLALSQSSDLSTTPDKSNKNVEFVVSSENVESSTNENGIADILSKTTIEDNGIVIEIENDESVVTSSAECDGKKKCALPEKKETTKIYDLTNDNITPGKYDEKKLESDVTELEKEIRNDIISINTDSDSSTEFQNEIVEIQDDDEPLKKKSKSTNDSVIILNDKTNIDMLNELEVDFVSEINDEIIIK